MQMPTQCQYGTATCSFRVYIGICSFYFDSKFEYALVTDILAKHLVDMNGLHDASA